MRISSSNNNNKNNNNCDNSQRKRRGGGGASRLKTSSSSRSSLSSLWMITFVALFLVLCVSPEVVLADKSNEEQLNNNDNHQRELENDSTFSTSTSNWMSTVSSGIVANFPNNVSNINTTALSLSACEKIDHAVAYITSLDFDKTFVKLTLPNEQAQNEEFHDVYYLLMFVAPISFIMTFFGSILIVPTCILSAAGMGVFTVFHFVNHGIIFGNMDCQMKLAASIVGAFIAAMAASSFVRFGLFTVGAIATGGGTYLLFDAFPILDWGVSYIYGNTAGASPLTESDLSAIGWFITIAVGITGGLMLRLYEQASLEVVTSVLGGIGCSYSLHTFIIIKGGQLDRSLVFLIASIICICGWRFQRNRRLKYEIYYHAKKNDDNGKPSNYNDNNTLPQYQQQQAVPPQLYPQPVYMAAPPPAGPPPATWEQMQSLLQSQQLMNDNKHNASNEQIAQLTKAMTSFMEKMNNSNTSKEGGGGSSIADIKKLLPVEGIKKDDNIVQEYDPSKSWMNFPFGNIMKKQQSFNSDKDKAEDSKQDA